MSWPLVKLGQIVQNCNAKRVPLKQSDRLNRQGCYDYYGASGVIDHIDDYIFDGDYLLIGEDGNNLISRSSPIAFHANGKFWVNNHAHILASNGRADLGFLAYYINSINLEPYVTGSAQPKLNKKNLDSILVPLPPLDEQKRIAAILDKADAIRQKRKQAIELADEFLRSVFLDMFGDPVTNPKGWEVKNIVNLASKEKHAIKRGPFGGALKKEIFVDSGYLVYEQYHALNNNFEFARYFIDESKYQELEAFKVSAGDIIISCSGVNLGRLAIVPEGSPEGIINQALLKIKLDESKMLNDMFVAIFTHPNFKNEFFGEHRGSGVPNFPPMSTFKEFGFIVPPLDEQKQYLRVVSKIKVLKEG